MRLPDMIQHTQNIYFQLTREFNARGLITLLASGQAVVYYKLAIMSKDGDWILRESEAACCHVLEVLEHHGARYRAGAPLDIRWLAGGWSSHLEFTDSSRRRIRCDFFSRPPRVTPERLRHFFTAAEPSDELPVVDLESLISMKQTQRAKDYPIIGELSRRLPPEQELELTTDPDRVLELAGHYGRESQRPAVRAALDGQSRLAVVLALAEEADQLQQRDRVRLQRYEQASRPYLVAVSQLPRSELALPGGHDELVRLAEELLPENPMAQGSQT